MPVQPITNEFMALLPSGLRPNPWNIDEEMMTLASKGWIVRDVFAAMMASTPREPGHVVAQLRRMVEQPAPAKRDEWKFGHQKCNNPMHGEACEICRCHKGFANHHVPVPATAEIKQMLRAAMAKTEVPEW
jgi:hypothetical protein